MQIKNKQACVFMYRLKESSCLAPHRWCARKHAHSHSHPRKHTTQLVAEAAPVAPNVHPPPPAHKRQWEGLMLSCWRHPVVLCHSTGLVVRGKWHTTAGSSLQLGNNANDKCWGRNCSYLPPAQDGFPPAAASKRSADGDDDGNTHKVGCITSPNECTGMSFCLRWARLSSHMSRPSQWLQTQTGSFVLKDERKLRRGNTQRPYESIYLKMRAQPKVCWCDE